MTRSEKQWMSLMKKLSLILNSIFFCLLLISIAQSSDQKVITSIHSGTKVIDGDTIKINNKKIRLFGIDAPEQNQICKNKNDINYKCGVVAKKILEKIASKSLITCFYNNYDRYKRILGTCYTVQILGNIPENGIKNYLLKEDFDLNGALVRFGYAVAYKKYSKKYLNEQEIAKKNKIGMWSGKFDMPWEWRKKNK